MTFIEKTLLPVLPSWLRTAMTAQELENLQEIRLRLDQPPELIGSRFRRWISRTVSREDLHFCINTACRYSPWTAETAALGYLTAPGGHRIGICGEVTIHSGTVTGIREVHALCIRTARDLHGISRGIDAESGSVVILGRPGSGKTTLLRDLIRQISNQGPGSVCVVDERCELFPLSQGKFCFPLGSRTDVLSGCPKAQGLDMAIRTMGPGTVAVDEITADADARALLRAGWCGVGILATAHACDVEDFKTRPAYRELWEQKLFQTAVVMQPDQSWREERLV